MQDMLVQPNKQKGLSPSSQRWGKLSSAETGPGEAQEFIPSPEGAL